MYQRKRKNDFYKKVEQMIAGRKKRPYIDTTNINDNNNNGGTININDNNNISDTTNDNNNGGTTNINDNSNIGDTTNDNSNNISDFSNDNRDIGWVNSSPNNNKITLTWWTNVNKKIEGIRKFEDKQDKQLLQQNS